MDETDILPVDPAGGETQWWRVLAARDGEGDVRVHLDSLIRTHWRAVYRHIRRNWGKTNEEAKDLTQEFFTRFVEKNFLKSVDPGRGRFRSFLKACLENFLRDQRDRESAQKRSPGPTVPLEFIAPIDVPEGRTSFDHEWAVVLCEVATSKLEQVLSARGRPEDARMFRDYYLSPPPGVTHRDLAKRYGLSETDVNNRLHAARVKFREIAYALIRETVLSPADLWEEIRELASWDPEGPLARP